MPLSRKSVQAIWLLLLAGALLGLAGCGTIEGDAQNYSEQPWNRQRTWETGLPSGINDGR